MVSQAGGRLLTEAVRVSGPDRLSGVVARWRKPLAVHNLAKVITDLTVMSRWAGDCLADVTLLRAEPGVFGRVAWNPTVSRTIDALADVAPRALSVINNARALARARVWKLAADMPHPLPTAGGSEAAAPPPRSRRGPEHPHHQGHRTDQPAPHDFAQNQIGAIVALACELTAWMQTLASPDTTPAAGNPNGYDYDCSPSLGASPTPAAASCYTYPRTHPGPRSPSRRLPRYGRCPPPANHRQRPIPTAGY